ncbi:MAG: glycolate oxidase subunit GlcF [Rhodocyclaceae bacterium]|nr:glycolate oxidase subunit GlcF [Rhodocyclaceae bacterium]
MQTQLADFIRDTADGQEADAILRKCVHCGFCTATCPTYQLLGDELDGPRGRIYLIKQVLEGVPATATTQLHLDRCLTCRACETTCPSGVHYSRLLDIGRVEVERQVPRSPSQRGMRYVLKNVLPKPFLFSPLLAAGRTLRPLLPARLRNKIAPAAAAGRRPAATHARRMLALAGCVQPTLTPATNAAAARVLDRLGISLIEAPDAGCCGALAFHLNDVEAARDAARRNIDAWWPLIEGGIDTLVMTASGCGVQVRDYGHLLREDAAYAGKAQRVSSMCRDIGEVLVAEREAIAVLLKPAPPQSIAFHSPCTLQHGQQLRGGVESLLQLAGYALNPVRDAHLCCGSAGTYSLLQPELATRLRDNKLAALQAGEPAQIATANVGCQCHLAGASNVPVRHWIELLDERMR